MAISVESCSDIIALSGLLAVRAFRHLSYERYRIGNIALRVQVPFATLGSKPSLDKVERVLL